MIYSKYWKPLFIYLFFFKYAYTLIYTIYIYISIYPYIFVIYIHASDQPRACASKNDLNMLKKSQMKRWQISFTTKNLGKFFFYYYIFHFFIFFGTRFEESPFNLLVWILYRIQNPKEAVSPIPGAPPLSFCRRKTCAIFFLIKVGKKISLKLMCNYHRGQGASSRRRTGLWWS